MEQPHGGMELDSIGSRTRCSQAAKRRPRFVFGASFRFPFWIGRHFVCTFPSLIAPARLMSVCAEVREFGSESVCGRVNNADL